MTIQNKNIVLALLFILFSISQAFAQTKKENHTIWQNFIETSLQKTDKNRQITPGIYRTVTLDLDTMKDLLKEAPLRFTTLAKSKTVILELPMPDGKSQRYQIVEAPVLHPDLGSQYPMIHAYAGQGIDDPKAFLRFDVTQKGFHAMISSPHHSAIFIDPYAKNDTEHYIVYYKKDLQGGADFECLVEHEKINNQLPSTENTVKSLLAGDCIVRKYRLALACTGEYALFHGSTTESVLAAMNTTMTRVNGVFERDASITMEIVPNNNLIVFLNASTDPYSNNDASAMLTQNQNTIDNLIGTANYDIGHVFSTGGGGLASLRSPCHPQRKARAVTGRDSPVGDPFDIDYVAHEMGHQYGANHTQNNDCNNVPGVSVEPGSASTIMGYAGICAPDVQNNSDDYFHIISIREITDNIILGTSSTCPEEIDMGNNQPIVNAGNNYTIPKSTPFELKGTATDVQGIGSLTYTWEQMDAQTAIMPPVSTNTSGPAFRSIYPSALPSRVFPPLEDIINNNTPTWEVLPSVGRAMKFTFTARDNNMGNGCTGDGDMALTFAGNAGPFVVTTPNTAIVWNAGSTETVTWEVANTNQSPVNCSKVDILLSTDGGYTYPIILASSVLNNGTADIIVPNELGDNNRVRINGFESVFFDISNTSFTIEEGVIPDYTFGATPDFQNACADGTAVYELAIEALGGFNSDVSFEVTGLPIGATVSFSPETINTTGTTQMTIDNLDEANAGFYTIEVTATSGGISKTVIVTLSLTADAPDAISLSTPANGASNQPLSVELNWENDNLTEVYHIEVATTITFPAGNIVQSGVSLTSTYTVDDLEPLTLYYWHVSGSNNCGDGDFGQVFSFVTGGEVCNEYENTESQIISANGALTIMSTINIPDDVTVTKASITNLNIAHSWIGDVDAKLASPNGTEVKLFDQPGNPAEDFGCSGDDILVSFADDAEMSAADFENTCGDNPAIEGDFMPLTPFAAVINEMAQGDWILSVRDNAPTDGGQLNEWSLEVCYELPSISTIEVQQQTLIVETGQSGMISEEYLHAISDNPACLNIGFIITSLPVNGIIDYGGFPTIIGDIFSNNDFTTNLFTYTHDGSDTDSDSFTFDVICYDGNSIGGWSGGNIFNIQIVDMIIFAANANITAEITCKGDENGQITVTAQGGVLPLTYSIDGENFQEESVFENLPAGNYTIIVQDGNNVQITTQEVMLTEPDAISAIGNVLLDEITVDAIGGTGVLTYSIDGVNFQTSNVFTSLDNGTYTIIIMDENDCQAEIEVAVGVSNLSVSITLENDITCAEEEDATISVEATGGTPPYTYSINDSDPQDSNIFTGLGAGFYTVVVADNEGFEVTTSTITVIAPQPIFVSISVNDNEIIITAAGGTGDFSYSIDGVNFQTSNIFADVPNGTYTVIIMDENECQTEEEVVIGVNTLVISIVLENDITCVGEDDASISVGVTGGTAPYAYSINDSTPQDSNIFTNLAAGNYTVVVSDDDGFEITSTTITVTEPEPITASASVDEFEITVTAAGGTGDLTYSIDGVNFQPSNIFPNLNNGTYTVIIMDENECQTEVEAIIGVNTLGVSIILENDITCAGEDDATISVEVTGGAEPYAYSINDSAPQDNNIFTGLGAGNYTVVVSDDDGFEITSTTITVTEPELITASASVNEFEITVIAAGGTGSLTYSIDGINFQDSNIFPDLANGDYIIIIMDENECQTEVEATVGVNSLIAVAEITQEILCANGNDAIITIDVSGGTEPYQYSLDDGNFQNSPIFDGVAAGIHEITVVDTDGFLVHIPPFSISEPQPISVQTTIDGNSNLIITANGGTGDLTYSLDGDNYEISNVFSDVDNGSYTVFVQDENGCITTTEIEVNAILSAAFGINGVDCFDDDSGSIEITGVTGGTAPYTYNLNGGNFQSSPVFNNLSAGTQVIGIMDALGNTYETAITLANPSQINITPVLQDNNLTINASGGGGTFQYSIDGGATFGSSNTFNGLEEGTYEIIVQDSNGCQESTTVTIMVDGLNIVKSSLSLQLFPNPSAGLFTLNINQETNHHFEITVFDALGRIVYRSTFEKTATDFSLKVNLKHLVNGTYFLKLTDGILVGQERILIIR